MSAADKKEIVSEIVSDLSSECKERKVVAVIALGVLKVKKYADRIVDLLASADEEIVKESIKALGRINNKSSVKHLLEFILKNDEKFSSLAYETLNNIDLEPAVKTIVNCCDSDLSPQIRALILNLACKIKLPEVAKLMSQVLGQSKDKDCLCAAVKYFICNPAAEHHTTLKMLSSERDWELALSATVALSRLKDHGSAAQLKRLVRTGNYKVRRLIVDLVKQHLIIEDRDLFCYLFEDPRGEIREASVPGLSLFALDERVKIIKDWLARETDSKIYNLVLKKAAEQKSQVFFSDFYNLLHSNDDSKRKIALYALKTLDKNAVEAIIAGFDKMPLLVKEQVIILVGRLKTETSRNLIIKCLNAKERWLRINAVAAAEFDDQLQESIFKLLQEDSIDPWVLARAATAAGTFKNPCFQEPLLKHLQHSDPRVRANCIDALSRLNYSEMVLICKKMIADRNDRVKVNAAIALHRCADESAFEYLKKMASSKNRWVRASAAFALGQINDNNALTILTELFSDSDEMVYINALKSVSLKDDISMLKPLVSALRKKRVTTKICEEILETFSTNIRRTTKFD